MTDCDCCIGLLYMSENLLPVTLHQLVNTLIWNCVSIGLLLNWEAKCGTKCIRWLIMQIAEKAQTCTGSSIARIVARKLIGLG